jgi:hypothetical protein
VRKANFMQNPEFATKLYDCGLGRGDENVSNAIAEGLRRRGIDVRQLPDNRG